MTTASWKCSLQEARVLEKVERREETRNGRRRRMIRFVDRRNVGVQGMWKSLDGINDRIYLQETYTSVRVFREMSEKIRCRKDGRCTVREVSSELDPKC